MLYHNNSRGVLPPVPARGGRSVLRGTRLVAKRTQHERIMHHSGIKARVYARPVLEGKLAPGTDEVGGRARLIGRVAVRCSLANNGEEDKGPYHVHPDEDTASPQQCRLSAMRSRGRGSVEEGR